VIRVARFPAPGRTTKKTLSWARLVGVIAIVFMTTFLNLATAAQAQMAGKQPNIDFLCFQYPGTAGSFTFNSDQFAMFKVGEAQEVGQLVLASAVMDKNFQEQFSLAKGSIPARIDIPDTKFDACGKKSMSDLRLALRNDSMLGSFAHGHAVPEATKVRMIEVVSNFFNKGGSPAEATQQLMAAATQKPN